MPMPHRTQMQVIKRRLVGKEGSDRIRELRAILAELPGYRNGPYADIRKWVEAQLEQTRTRKRVIHRDSIAVRREGAAQIALVGPPNAGKSSLLQALSHVRIKTGDYAFTTTRPVPAVTRIGGVLVQLVEIPGLIEGAHDGRGGGRALLGVLRGADAILYCHDASAPVDELRKVVAEVHAAAIELPSAVAATKSDEADAVLLCHDVTADPNELARVIEEVRDAGIERPAVLVATKADEAAPEAVARLETAFPELEVVAVSVLDDESLERLRDRMWRLTGLIRIYLRDDEEPIALRPPVNVTDVARSVHHELAARCEGARVWGPSARFAGQRVGRAHVLADGDAVEILG